MRESALRGALPLRVYRCLRLPACSLRTFIAITRLNILTSSSQRGIKGRRTPLDIYGPHGLRGMTDAIYEAWKENIDVRTNGLEHLTPGGYRVGVHEISRALCSTAVA